MDEEEQDVEQSKAIERRALSAHAVREALRSEGHSELERTWTALPASPEVANTVIPVAPSDVVHSASAVISGLSAASAAASLISPTSQTGPTSTLRSRAGSPGGMPKALATLSSGVTFGSGERT